MADPRTRRMEWSEGAALEVVGRIARLEAAIENAYRQHPCRGNEAECCWMCLLRDEMTRPVPTGDAAVIATVRG